MERRHLARYFPARRGIHLGPIGVLRYEFFGLNQLFLRIIV